MLEICALYLGFNFALVSKSIYKKLLRKALASLLQTKVAMPTMMGIDWNDIMSQYGGFLSQSTLNNQDIDHMEQHQITMLCIFLLHEWGSMSCTCECYYNSDIKKPFHFLNCATHTLWKRTQPHITQELF
ncbi:hypothetical protein ACJX0J_031753, partial [Zea mays]